MALLVGRELSVVYTPPGGSAFTLAGTSSKYLIDGKLVIDKSYPAGRVSFDVIVTSKDNLTDLDFVTNVTALEDAVRQKWGRLQILTTDRVSGTQRTLLDVNPSAGASGNTGWNVVGDVSKPGTPDDTNRSRRYRVTFTFGLPASISSFNGRRDSRIEVEYSMSRRRRLRITGTYTALTTLNATAQYQAQVATYAATIYTALGGTWNVNRALERFVRDDQDKELDFEVVYDELIYSEVAGTSIFDDPRLSNPSFEISREAPAPGDTFDQGAVVRLTTLVATYTAWVDSTLSTQLSAIYDATIRPWVIANAVAFAKSGAVALIDENPGIDPLNNRISARLVFVAAGDSQILSRTVTTQDSLNLGKILTALWDGNPWRKTKDQGPMVGRRTITAVQRVLGQQATNAGPGHGGGGGGADQFGIFGAFGAGAAGLGVDFQSSLATEIGTIRARAARAAAGANAGPNGDGVAAGSGDPFKGLEKELMEQEWTATPLTIGKPGNTIDVTDQVERTVFEFYLPEQAPTPTGGGGSNKQVTLSGLGQNPVPGG